MAQLIGVVSKVIGQVFAVEADGSRRPLAEGDRLFAGEQLETGASGAIAVRLSDGGELTLGRESNLHLSPQLLAEHAPHVNAPEAVTPSEAQLTSVEKLQAAIAAGIDPTQEAEATAAGPNGSTATGELGGGHSFVLLTEVAGRVDPIIGFPTAGFGGIPEFVDRRVAATPEDNSAAPSPPDRPVTLTGLAVEGGELTVNEADLPQGSINAPGLLTQQGTFQVSAPDGLSNLSVGGIQIYSNGLPSLTPQSQTTAHGILTITGFNASTGTVTYTYTLTASETHPDGGGTNNLPESFAVHATDSNGSQANASLDINVIDDVPTARADTAQGIEGATITTLVLDNDTRGADGAAVVGVKAGDQVENVDSGLNTVINGTYGTLTINAAGVAVYHSTPNAVTPPGATDVFVYTIRDGDGDLSSTTLTINIADSGLTARTDSDVKVYESALDTSKDGLDLAGGTVTGSNPTSTAETATGNLVDSTSGGTGPLTFALVGSDTGSFGQIHINGDGTYTYTLTSPVTNTPNGDNGANIALNETFTYSATDALGNTVNGTIQISIVDDVPTAKADTAQVAEGNTVTTNVLGNDTLGADGAVVVGVKAGGQIVNVDTGLNTSITGTYGTLTVNAAGVAVYHSNPNSVTPPGATDIFTYTIRDGDGDLSTTTLTINIADSGLTARTDSDVKVYENALDTSKDGIDLAGGTVTGSNPSSTAETATGNLVDSTSGGTGPLTFALVGSATGSFGQILVNSDGTYTYTLTSPVTNTPSGDNGANIALNETFTYSATDAVGNTVNGTIQISIVDDVPTAKADTAQVNEGSSVTTNVLGNDTLGADGAVVVGVKAGGQIVNIDTGLNTNIVGTYGTLTVNAAGVAIYHSNPNSVTPAGATDVFTYTIRDGDGDLSTTTLTINIADSGLTARTDSDVKVYENALDTSKDGIDLAGGTVTGSNPTSTAETATGNLVDSTSGGTGPLTFALVSNATGTYGQIQVNSNGTYTYTLTSPVTNTPNGDNGANIALNETFTYSATDALGNTVNGTIQISIVDDVPTAKADTAQVAEGNTVTTNVLGNDTLGADGAAVVGVKAGSQIVNVDTGLNTSITGTYGTLTVNAAGVAIYHSNPNSVTPAGATDVFTYTIRDGDGDLSTTTLTINIADSGLTARTDSDVKVYENALDTSKDGIDLAGGTVTGSNPTSTAETATGNLVDSTSGGTGPLTFALVSNATGTYGQIQVNSNGTYTYTLTSPVTNTPNGDNGANIALNETFTYSATDALGNTVNGTIQISIVDDVPTAKADTAQVTEGNTVTTNVLGNDTLGADGAAVVGVKAGSQIVNVTTGLNTSITGTYGTLTVNAAGVAIYHSNPNSVTPAGATDIFTYTIRDGDGDLSTTTLTISIADSGLTARTDSDVKVYESALDTSKDGIDLAGGTVTGSNPTSTAETATGNLVDSTSGGTGPLTFALVSNATGTYGQIQVNSNGTYTYTLTSPVTNTPSGDNGANIALNETFTYSATDAVGNTVTGTIQISIVDDVPTAKADTAQVAEGNTVTTNVLGNDTLGADGAAVVGVKAGSQIVNVTTGLNTSITGTYGTLTVNAAGVAVYHSNPNSVTPAGATDVFTYTIRDGDGDLSTTTLSINVADSGLKAVPDGDVTVYEKALDLSKDGQDLAAGTVIGSDPSNTGETASGTLVGAATGGTGPLTFALVGSATGSYGQILLNSNGTYTYTLTSAPKTSPSANDGPNVLTESFAYKATDALGNTVNSTIVISIVDDVPKAVASERSVTTVEVDSNLLLIIDISGSMADASGVPGLSRLALAKQAISTLLDKYDDMGDVKVQVVTFSTNATDRTSTWVDIATAKTIVNGLTAGGNTNYDAAVATAQTAFGTSGKLVGAQNVGYFFSDGEPTAGQGIGTADETAWKAFLDANGIKSYAIGLGTGVNSAALNPLAYDGSTHTDTNSVVVTDLNQLNSVLAGTVQGAPVTGSLLTDGSFGADGGFVKSLVVGGITYTFDPTANSNQGGMTVAGGTGTGTFDTVSNSITITTGSGGTLIVDMDTGEYIYTPPKVSGVQVTENIGFVLVDNDGDLGGAQLVIKVNPNAPPVAGDDHVITNLLAANINVPAALLLANDTDPNGDPLNAAPTTFNTGWVARGAEFTGTTTVPGFAGAGNSAANQALTVARSAFTSNSAMMTAVAVVSGYLGAVNGAAANAQDVITVTLKQGETLTLDHSLAASHLAMEWQYVPTVGAATAYTAIADGGLFTALQDGTYRIHLTNLADAQAGNAAENYQLTMTVNYAGAADVTPDYSGTYTANDSHGGSDSAAVSITYQAGHTLTGTSGDDVLLAAPGDNILNGNDGNDVLSVVSGTNSLYGGNGNDLLFSGSGNDVLDGGAGNDTVSYLNATAGVTVDLGHVGQQNTVGAGLDTLVSIENLIGSNYNDTLTGDNNANVLSGGLGNDTLIGGGGDDLLIGGMGNNTLTGGPGADTFQWLQGNSGHDVVTDFSLGTDKLDLAQLLQGENASSASLDDYLHFKVTGSGATLVSTIDISSVAGAAPTQTIDLAGVNLATHYGVTPGSGGVIAAGADTATIINGMLNDHSLKVDTV